VLGHAADLALLSALSPTALLVVAVYLGSARPRETALCYLAGAVTMSLILGVVFVVMLRHAGLSLPRNHGARSAVRFGLGLLLIAAAIVIAVRKPRQPDPAKARQGIVSRMIARPAPATAFAVGVIVFGPSLTFLAALQVIATAQAGVGLTAVAVVVVVVITVLLVWLPLVLYLVAPEPTTRRLTAFNRRLRAQATILMAAVLIAVGAIMIGSAAYGLATGT
jgi:Sap-like sulfolipid-1-addressing protein